MKELYFFKQYLEDKYGQAIYRIPISLPLSCPNRVANKGIGCTFCAEDGSAARHLRNTLNLKEQIDKGIAYAQQRYGAKAPYIAYFQAFTNTYAPVDQLRKYYSEALSHGDFKMIMISTRSDALPDDVLDYLSELNEKYDLWVELGVQSTINATLDKINRGETFESVQQATKKLADRNIKVAAHIILGLPGESIEEFKQTARDISTLPFSAVKIHHLMVLKNTPLAKSYAKGEFKTLNEYEYAAALIEVLRILPENWPLMRITADADSSELIAPKWWMKKGQFISYIQSAIKNGTNSDSFNNFSTIPKVKTEDGSYTFYHPEYKQHFHTLAGAETEAVQKFVEPSQLKERILKQDITLLDVGFGLGYNTINAVKAAMGAPHNLTIHTLEFDKKTLVMGRELFYADSLEAEIITTLLTKGEWTKDNCHITLHLGDARETVKELKIQDSMFNVIFLDGFSPDKNPQLWSYDFFRSITALTADDAVMVTYSSAFPIRAALMRCGLHIGQTKAYGRKRGGTIATKSLSNLTEPLADKDLNILTQSTAGLCYRDKGLNCNARQILKMRDKTQKRLRARGVPKWIK